MAKKRYYLDDYKQKQAEDVIEIEVADGRVFTVPSPALWPDELMVNIKKDPGGVVDRGRLLLGADYDAFVEAGGSAALLDSIIGDAYKDSVPE